ncbi:MAG: sulfite exporter TauE/SafE family protein [Betaproteobacteria bacterium]
MDILPILFLLFVGACTGLLAGMLGIGGGMVMVPFMTLYLDYKGFSADAVIKVAIATSLASILFTSISNVRAQHQRGAVRWDLVRAMSPGIVAGSLVGSHFASSLPAGWLALHFSVFNAVMSTRKLRQQKPTAVGALPAASALLAAGGLIGGASALVGAGGAFITTPFLVKRNVPIHAAVGTSAACGFPVALAGTAGYILAGWSESLPQSTLGYVYLPGLLIVSAASMFTAPLGVRIAHATSSGGLKRFFSLMLYALSLYMLWRAWRVGLTF